MPERSQSRELQRKDLLVAVAQWLALPGRPDTNLEAAIAWIERAGAAGADLVVLPELWLCGYDMASLRADVQASAEPVPGPRTRTLAAVARRLRMWVFAGSLPERHGDEMYNTAVVFNREGTIVAQHRKVHLYRPTREDAIFKAGSALTSFADAELGNVGVTLCFDGDFPEVARVLGERGVDLVVQSNAYEWEARSYWDLFYPATALTNGQWWILANQCGTTSAGTLLGASRVISPAGTVVSEARRTQLGQTPEPELLLCRLSESAETAQARTFARVLREERSPGSNH